MYIWEPMKYGDRSWEEKEFWTLGVSLHKDIEVISANGESWDGEAAYIFMRPPLLLTPIFSPILCHA